MVNSLPQIVENPLVGLAAWPAGHIDSTVHCHGPFFRKIVEIERFALRAAILVPNVPRLAWGDPGDLAEK